MKFEKYLFYILIAVHLVPIIILPYFVTHDGPSHVNNAEQIYRMLFGTKTAASDFLIFNPQILPNWIGHFLQILFNLAVESPVAERIVIAIYTISFPLAFRALVLAVNPKAVAGSYLVFPYIQAFSLLIGLISFCLGIAMLFYVLSLWKKNNFIPVRKQFAWLSICFFLLYFSHLFVFMLAIFALGFYISWSHLIDYRFSDSLRLSNIKLWWQRISWLLLVSAIPLLFTFLFSFHQASKTTTEIPEFATMWMLFKDVRPIIALNYDLEKVYSHPLFYTYIVLVIAGLIWRAKSFRENGKRLFLVDDAWLILSLIMTLFYFVLPDDIFSGGILAIRFCLFSYLFLLVWISVYCPRKILFGGALLSVMASLLLLNQRFPSLRILSDEAVDLASCTDKMKDGGVLLTLNYSDNWMLDNVSGYLGGDRNIMVLDNYEANQVHFPLMWKEDRNPELILGNAGKSNRPCIDLDKFRNISGHTVDYVLVLRRPVELNDSCTLSADNQIRVGYKEIFITPHRTAVLYERKQ